MAFPRLCVSIPVHEQPAVVFDQVENVRSFLPADTVVVLHLSHGFADPASLEPLLPEGVYVNPTSHRTTVGDLVHVHNDNFRWVCERERFDAFVIHASNDLYVRAGAERYVAQSAAGVQQQPTDPQMPWGPAQVAYRDMALGRMLAALGTNEIYGSQPEGCFFAADLFAEMVALIERYWRPGDGEGYVREEIYYPTLTAALASAEIRPPLLYSEMCRGAITPARVRALASGRYGEDPQDPDVRGGTYPLYDFDHLYAVKRVARRLHDPVRRSVRSLARACGTGLRLRVPFEARTVVVIALIDELLADPAMLAAWGATVTDSDDVTLAVTVPAQDLATRAPALEGAVHRAGLDEPGAADLLLVPIGAGSFAEGVLRWCADAIYRPHDAPTLDLFDETPAFAPNNMRHFPHFIAHLNRRQT